MMRLACAPVQTATQTGGHYGGVCEPAAQTAVRGGRPRTTHGHRQLSGGHRPALPSRIPTTLRGRHCSITLTTQSLSMPPMQNLCESEKFGRQKSKKTMKKS